MGNCGQMTNDVNFRRISLCEVLRDEKSRRKKKVASQGFFSKKFKTFEILSPQSCFVHNE